ncbi:MAG TPA: glycosyltransferase, partial [Longimicrobium sp.]|nr:glycosyltransferase [Longimicrobium sp.]
ARVLLDTDPMFTQIQLAEAGEGFTPGGSGIRALVAGHTHHFTFGESVGLDGCRLPPCGVDWKPTRQPIFLAEWPASPLPAKADAAFTTLTNWTAGRPLRHAGETWGQKDVEFLRFADLPRRVPGVRLAVAVGQTGGAGEPFPRAMAEEYGWTVLDPDACAPDPASYRAFIQASRGELSVAKETYVKAGTGWFSGRSASYLASGRPVVTQDTGWSRHLPTGDGLFAFRTPDEAAAALDAVAADPARHARAARRIAEEHFDSAIVLRRLLAEIGA